MNQDEFLKVKGIDFKALRASQEKRLLPSHRSRAILNHWLPRVLPPAWHEATPGSYDRDSGRMYVNGEKRQSLIVSVAREDDGFEWLHYSIAGDSMPSWDDIRDAKELFAGRDSYAIMVIPPRTKYVNLHPHALHWFCRVEGHPLPEFSAFGSL